MDWMNNLVALQEATKRLVETIDSLPSLGIERAKAESMYEKILGKSCEEFAGTMAANLVEKKAKAACSDLLKDRNQKIYLHEDARLAVKCLPSITSSFQTQLKVTQESIGNVPNSDNM